MDLDNPVETVVLYLLIERMTCFDRWDDFLMMSVLVYVMYTGQDLR